MEDALGLSSGKLRLFAGRYRRSEGTEAHSFHFIDLADARVIFGALCEFQRNRRKVGFSRISVEKFQQVTPTNGVSVS